MCKYYIYIYIYIHVCVNIHIVDIYADIYMKYILIYSGINYTP
jgi:hypothetical protein